jgi:hypothetical protein
VQRRIAFRYSRDPNLFLWDLVCNVVATQAGAEYHAISNESIFNPTRLPFVADTYFGKASDVASTRGPLVMVSAHTLHYYPL